MRNPRSLLPPVCCLAALTIRVAIGQIAFDSSLGSAGPVVPSGNTFRIDANPDAISGGNLFHSFSEFSIPSGMVADFESPAAIQRIIARVTGEEVSKIEGTLMTNGSGADFFLINPNGILFGKNAKIDVRGAFTASTAETLTDGHGGTHSMRASDQVLFSAPIAAYGFLGAAQDGHIDISGSVLNNPLGNIQFIGRSVSFSNAQVTAGGDLNVMAVGESTSSLAADCETETPGVLGGRVSICDTKLASGEATHRIAVAGVNVDIDSSKLNFNGIDNTKDFNGIIKSTGGSIKIEASNRLCVSNGSGIGSVQEIGDGTTSIDIRSMGRIVVKHSQIISQTRTSGLGASIYVRAAELEVEGDGLIEQLGILSLSEASAKGGAVDVHVTGELKISKFGLIGSESSNRSNGGGGGVIVNAGKIHITGAESNNTQDFFQTGIIGQSDGSGVGGSLTVDAGEILLSRGGLIDSSSFGAGKGGAITVHASKIMADRAESQFFTGIGSDTETQGDGGNVSVYADEISLLKGGLISSSTSGAGNAGSLSVVADRFTASGSGIDSPFVAATRSGLAAVTVKKEPLPTPTGNGGDIHLSVGQLILQDQGSVSTLSEGSGRAGNIKIVADNFKMDSGARISVEGFAAEGGTADLTGHQSFEISNSEIEARSATIGGSISISSDGLILLRDSKVSANAGKDGGNIDFANTQHLVLNRTPLSANAVEGDGGKITVSTGAFFASASPLSVKSEKGAPGTVEIRTLDTLGGGRETEEETLLDPDDILQPDCALRDPDNGGSFTKGGKGGTRRLPGGYLPSFRIIE